MFTKMKSLVATYMTQHRTTFDKNNLRFLYIANSNFVYTENSVTQFSVTFGVYIRYSKLGLVFKHFKVSFGIVE